jgi:hypothetical protein
VIGVGGGAADSTRVEKVAPTASALEPAKTARRVIFGPIVSSVVIFETLRFLLCRTFSHAD